MRLFDTNRPIGDSKHFRWSEALWLATWGMHAVPTDIAEANILKTAQLMEQIREMFGRVIHVHSWYRPEHYNRVIGGAQASAHLSGLAVDFSVHGLECDYVRSMLEPRITLLGCRMEKLPDSNWIHVDLREPGIGGRYFAP